MNRCGLVRWRMPAPRGVSVVALVLTLALRAPAQVGWFPTLTVQPETWSGALHNPDPAETSVAWSEVVTVPNAGTIRLGFGPQTILGPGASVVVTSVLDHQTQALDAAALARTHHRSAWFNGSAVSVMLRLGPGAYGSVDVIEAVGTQPPSTPPGALDSICGSDDRVPSAWPAVFRMRVEYFALGVGYCTGTLLNAQSVAVSAGSCFDPPPPGTFSYISAVTAEFNVPSSTPAGVVVAAAPEDQYDIASVPYQSSMGASGNNWAVFAVGVNSLAQTAYANQGALPIYGGAVTAGMTVEVVSYGDDSWPSPTSTNYTQRRSQGSLPTGAATPLGYTADTSLGSVGAPVTAGGQILGIHNTGGCGGAAVYNLGTPLSASALAAAISTLTTCGPTYLTNGVPLSTGSCASRAFTVATLPAVWNAVAAASNSSNWDLTVGPVTSSLPASSTDIALWNGHLGTDAVTGGYGVRSSGSSSGTLEFESAAPVTYPMTVSWSPNEVVQLYEFELASSGSYDVFINGDPSLRWAIYGPGGAAGWNAPSAALSGIVGDVPVVNTPLSPGWRALAITRNGGPGGVADPNVSIFINGHTTPLALAPNVSTPVPGSLFSLVQRVFTLSPTPGQWNGVAVVGPSLTGGADWDLSIGPAVSHFAPPYGGFVDFAIANGKLGAITLATGQVTQRPGSVIGYGGTAEHAVAQTFSVNTVVPATLPANHVIAVWQFNVPATQAYTISVQGSPQLFWDLYEPGADPSWRRRGANHYGAVGSPAQAGITLSPGWHAIVVVKDNGVTSADLPYAISVFPDAPVINIPADGIVQTSAAGHVITTTPTAGKWNAVIAGSGSDWDLSVGAGTSWFGAPLADSVLQNGHLGAAAGTSGVAMRLAGSTSATLQHVTAATLTLGVPANGSIPTGRAMSLFEFEVTTPGTYQVLTSGPAGLIYDLYFPGTDGRWFGRGAPIYGNVGSPPVSFAATVGWHALAIFHDGGPAPAPQSFSLLVCPAANTVLLPAGAGTSTVTSACQPFTVTPSSGRWNVVGIQSGVTSDWQVAIGSSQSNLVGNGPDFLVADGHPGSIAPTIGVFAQSSGSGGASVQFDTPGTPAALGATVTASIGNGEFFDIIECNVSAVGSGGLALTVSSPGGNPPLQWALYTPQSSSGWSSRAQANASGTVNGSTVSVGGASVGVYAVVVFRTSGVGPATASVTLGSGNPVPVASSVNPSSALVGGGNVVVGVTGTGFLPSSVVRYNGASVATTFNSATQLTAVLPFATLMPSAGTGTVTVVNPPPGGGVSAGLTFTHLNPLPVLSSITPSSTPFGSSAFTLTCNGSGFNSQSVVQWNGASRTTTLVSATQLTAAISAADVANGGISFVTVSSPAPGGGVTTSRLFQVTYPVPLITSVSPATATVCPTPVSSITIGGSNFAPVSVVRIDGSAVTTTYVNAGSLVAAVPATVSQVLGAHTITVTNPAPGGGISAPSGFTVIGLGVTAVSPASIAQMTAQSPPVTITVSLTGAASPGLTVFADGVSLPTTVASANTLHATVSASVLQARQPGGMAIAVQGCGATASNSISLRIGAGATANNQGTIGHIPLGDALTPGTPFTLRIEGGIPGQPFVLDIDPGNPPSQVAWPNAGIGMVYSLGSPAETVIFDGLGLVRPPEPFAVFSAGGAGATPPAGVFVLPGIMAPNPSLGVTFTMQGFFLDPASPQGFHLTWARLLSVL